MWSRVNVVRMVRSGKDRQLTQTEQDAVELTTLLERPRLTAGEKGRLTKLFDQLQRELGIEGLCQMLEKSTATEQGCVRLPVRYSFEEADFDWRDYSAQATELLPGEARPEPHCLTDLERTVIKNAVGRGVQIAAVSRLEEGWHYDETARVDKSELTS
jgi:hypothetical protein